MTVFSEEEEERVCESVACGDALASRQREESLHERARVGHISLSAVFVLSVKAALGFGESIPRRQSNQRILAATRYPRINLIVSCCEASFPVIAARPLRRSRLPPVRPLFTPGPRPARLGVSRTRDTVSLRTSRRHRQQHHGVRHTQKILGVRPGAQPWPTQQATEMHTNVMRVTGNIRIVAARLPAAAEDLAIRRNSQQIDAW